jgi:hypothetical protein
VTQPRLNIDSELVSLERSGFPWLTATVTLRETTTLQMRGAPSLTEVSDSTYLLERTLEGRRITAIDAESALEPPR